MPSFSIVMPSYNQACFIEQAVESVLQQNDPNCELVVVDAGSSDETLSLLKKYGAKITTISCPGAKQSEVINKGFDHVNGEIVAVLNADDMFLEGTAYTVGDYFTRHPKTDMIYGDFTIMDENGKKLMTHREIGFHYLSYLFLGKFIMFPTVFIRRTTYLRIGRFDTRLDYAMDQDYWLRLGQTGGRIRHLPYLLASYRWHPSSKSILCPEKAEAEAQMVRRRYLKGLLKHEWIYRAIAFLYKLRRIFLKLMGAKYESPPQPLILHLWKKGLNKRLLTSSLAGLRTNAHQEQRSR